jgi:DNA mismatch repair protein MutL
VEPKVNAAGAPDGTTIYVRDLFYNTPARLKFLKNPVAEWGHILQTIIRQSLTRPDVAFAIRWRGKPYLDLPAEQPLAERLAQILPPGAGADLLPLRGALHEVRVQGAVTSPRTTRRDRRHQYFFVNQRPIFFRPLPFALEEAYRGLIMTQQYPMGAVLVELPSEMVDVNVHPTKEEVRFHNEALVTGAVHRAVVEALRAADLVPRLLIPMPGSGLKDPASPVRREAPDPAAPPKNSPPPAAQAGPATPGESAWTLTRDVVPSVPSGSPAEQGQLDFVSSAIPAALPAPPYAEPLAHEEAGLIGRLRAAANPPRALAQVCETYILGDAGALGMLIIDQHAAHEKILYLKFLHQAEEAGALEVQPLMIPHSIELAPIEAAALEMLLPALKTAGFDVEPFGGGTFIVQSIPVLLERLDVPALLRDLIDEVGQGNLPREMRRLRERICARAACRAAVKSGDRLSLAEMQRLVDELMQTAEALRCPHGRPTVTLLTRGQIDRQFGRS